ncbi:MAG: hypothetical protein L0H93_14520 [Nocardioides sp.]|nr:hypothetical protein [Nocardioides sp.]
MNVRGTSAVLSSLVLGFGLTACGSEDEKTKDGAATTVEAYFDSFNDGDYSDACDELTDDYTQKMLDDWNDDEEGFGQARSCSAALKQGAELLRAFGELDDDEDLAKVDKVAAEIDGDTAVVDVTFKDDDPSKFELIYDDGDWLINEDLDDEAEGQEPDGATDDDTPDADDEAPVEPSAIGEPVELGDWTITVTKVEKNADATITKANEFNDKPRHQYVLVTYQAVYNGEARKASAEDDMSWSFTTSEAQVLEEADAVTPGDNQNWPYEVRIGGTLKGQVAFDVDPSVYDGATLGVEGYDEEFNEIFVDFTLD